MAFRNLIAAVSACLVASGCVSTPTGPTAEQIFTEAESFCGEQSLSAFGECLETELDLRLPAWRTDPHADLVQIYIAWAKAASNRLAAGEMTEEETGLGLALLRSRLTAIAQERNTRIAQTEAANQAANRARVSNALNQMVTGLALIEASRPQPQVQPQPLGNRMITCSQTGRFVNCY